MKKNKFRLSLTGQLIFCLVLTAGFLLLIRPASPGKTLLPSAATAKGPVPVPLIEIREDSLLALLDYFVKAQNSQFSVVKRANGVIVLHLSRFSNTPSSFYCENKSLLLITDQGFQIKVDARTNEINASFIRQEYKGVFYISVPSDVLCGLLRLHPNIR